LVVVYVFQNVFTLCFEVVANVWSCTNF